MAAVVARDPDAFGVLYDRYAPLVYTTCLRVVGEPAMAEDLVQDIFVRLWQRPEAFIPARGRFVTWLLSITRNRAVDEVRSRNRRRMRELPEPKDAPFAPVATARADDPVSLAELREEQVAVRQALAQLPPEQRRVLELAFFGGYTHQEIATRLREPLGTVKTRIRLGMQKLRASLERLR
jgi:RNA polymerase sigma-70 factor (ECF subfamily)